VRGAGLFAVAALALAGCDRPADPAPVPPAVAPPAEHWALGLGPDSAELAWLADPADPEDAPLRLICARGEGFAVVAPAFQPIGSEERLSVGAGGDAFALVAVAGEGPGGPLVRATGAIEEPLLAAIESGQPIAASYGAQRFGPVGGPASAMSRAFADSCRQLAARAAG